MVLWLKIILILLIIIVLITLLIKYIYRVAYDNGFRYGYENNPVMNQSTESIQESIKLLNSITLYKNNRIVVDKVIMMLKNIDEVSKISTDVRVKITSQIYSFLNRLFMRVKYIILLLYKKLKSLYIFSKEKLTSKKHYQ